MTTNFNYYSSVDPSSGSGITGVISVTTTYATSGAYTIASTDWSNFYDHPLTFDNLWQKFVRENEDMVSDDQKESIIRTSKTLTSTYNTWEIINLSNNLWSL